MANNLARSAEKFLNLMDRLRRVGPQSAPPKKAKISISQLGYLNFLATHPGCGIQAMSSGLGLSKPSVSIGVGHLAEAGLITRQDDPRDGRAVQLFLTPKGQDLYQRTLEFRCKKFEHLLTELNSDERQTLLNLLEKAIKSVENETSGEKK